MVPIGTPNEDTNLSTHARSLISDFVVRMKTLCILDYRKCRRFWLETVRMRKLIWNLAGPTYPKVCFLTLQLQKCCVQSLGYQVLSREMCPVSILFKSIAGRYRPVRVADGPITAPYRFIKNASWVDDGLIIMYFRVTMADLGCAEQEAMDGLWWVFIPTVYYTTVAVLEVELVLGFLTTLTGLLKTCIQVMIVETRETRPYK